MPTKKKTTKKDRPHIEGTYIVIEHPTDYVASELMYGDCVFTSDPVGYISDEIGNGLVLVGTNETIFVSQKEVDTVIKLIKSYTGT